MNSIYYSSIAIFASQCQQKYENWDLGPHTTLIKGCNYFDVGNSVQIFKNCVVIQIYLTNELGEAGHHISKLVERKKYI